MNVPRIASVMSGLSNADVEVAVRKNTTARFAEIDAKFPPEALSKLTQAERVSEVLLPSFMLKI